MRDEGVLKEGKADNMSFVGEDKLTSDNCEGH